MTRSAGRPNDSNGAPDERSEPDTESATFETARVRGRRGRPPIVVLAFLTVLAGVVGIGVAGRGPAEPAGVPPVALDSLGPGSPLASITPTPRLASASVLPDASPNAAPVRTTGPGPIQLVARRHTETMFVHGDVFVPRVTWVFVSLQDDSGRVAGWASVSVPGAAGPGNGDGPTLRFDVELAVPARFEDRLWVQANAYDAEGAQIASSRLELPPDGEIAIVPVRLTSPSDGDEVIYSGTVLVEGRLEVHAATVRIALESGSGGILDAAIVETSNRDGGIRPVFAPTLRVELAVPASGPAGRLWVVITAFNESGASVGEMRRPILIGRLAA